MSPLSLDHHVALDQIVGVPPESSVLFLAFSRESDDPDLRDMPPVGVSLVDEQAVELLRDWIDALPVE